MIKENIVMCSSTEDPVYIKDDDKSINIHASLNDMKIDTVYVIEWNGKLIGFEKTGEETFKMYDVVIEE